MKVLIIDDDPDIRRIAVTFMTRDGMTVLEAGSGEAGLVLAERDPPDVIVLDAVMPGKDGPTTLQEFGKGTATASIPVIFLTATRDEEQLQRLAGLGVRGVLRKPFNPATLAAQIRHILARR
jgi:two-component system, OmpR family, response regulator